MKTIQLLCSGHPVQEPDGRLVPQAALVLSARPYGVDVREHVRVDVADRFRRIQPVIAPDGFAGHLEVDGIFVLVAGLRDGQLPDMAAHGIEHGQVCEQFHSDEVRLLGMEADGAQGVLQLSEAGLDVPAHVVQFFHAFDGELEPVQVRDQDFPLLPTGALFIDAELHDAASDRAELLEVPPVVDRVLGVVLRMGLAHGVDQVQVRVGFVVLGVEMVRRGDAELHLRVALFVRELPYFLDIARFRPDDVVGVVQAVERLEHVEAGISPVHNEDGRDGQVGPFRHVDGRVALVGVGHLLDDAVGVRPAHQVEQHVGVHHGQVPERHAGLLGFQCCFPLGLVDGELGAFHVRHAERAAVNGVDPVRQGLVHGRRSRVRGVVAPEDVLEDLG